MYMRTNQVSTPPCTTQALNALQSNISDCAKREVKAQKMHLTWIAGGSSFMDGSWIWFYQVVPLNYLIPWTGVEASFLGLVSLLKTGLFLKKKSYTVHIPLFCGLHYGVS